MLDCAKVAFGFNPTTSGWDFITGTLDSAVTLSPVEGQTRETCQERAEDFHAEEPFA
jgi:hypothetical protein